MADIPDSKQADDGQVSADGTVELSETQLDTAKGGLSGRLNLLAADSGNKLQYKHVKIEIEINPPPG